MFLLVLEQMTLKNCNTVRLKVLVLKCLLHPILGMNSERLQFSVDLLCLCCHSINCFLVSSLTKLQKLDLTFLLICKAPTALTSAPLLFRQGNVTFSLNISVATLCTLHAVHLISSVACYNCHYLAKKSRFVMTCSLPPMSPVSPRCFPPK